MLKKEVTNGVKEWKTILENVVRESFDITVSFEPGKKHSKWREKIAKFGSLGKGMAWPRNGKETSVAGCENREGGER